MIRLLASGDFHLGRSSTALRRQANALSDTRDPVVAIQDIVNPAITQEYEFELPWASQPHRLYSPDDFDYRTLGEKNYELTDHLGNVRATVTDRKRASFQYPQGGDWTITGFTADITSAQDYYPFGWTMPGRKYNPGEYRYSFQGQEADNEIKGTGNSINYKYRMHDPRIGRFFAVDPLAAKFPHNGPYNFSENRVIDAFELEGLETITIEVAVRAIGPFVGASSFAGVGIGKDGLVAYAGYSAGLNFGLYGGAGIGAGFTMDDIGDFSGSSSEIGVAGGFKV